MKDKRNILIRWWILISLISIGFMGLFPTGIIYKIYNADITHISLGIFFIFFYYTIKVGIFLWKINSKDDLSNDEIKTYQHKAESGWFAADALFVLGFIGTVIGIAYGTEGFKEISDSAKVITTMSTGIGTALYTTIIGLICGILLKWQLYILCHYLDGLNPESNCGCSR